MKKKILLICGCLEAGKDGIGDYTMQLALALTTTNEVSVVALYDRFIQEPTLLEDGIVSYRIPSHCSWIQKEMLLTHFIKQINPSWISLQLVAFAFHDKGILRQAISPLMRSIGLIPLHIMLHELWLGEEVGASLKMKVWGKAIQYYLLKLIHKLKPVHIYVSCEINQYLLSKNKLVSKLAPIFSSIKVAEIENIDEVFQDNIVRKIQTNVLRNECFVAGFFGTIHPEWQPLSAIKALQKVSYADAKKLCIIFFGKIQENEILRIKSLLPADNFSVVLGIASPIEISQYVQLCDIGVTSNPELLISKSSSVATFLVHQKPVIVSRNDLKVAGFEAKTNDNPLVLDITQVKNYFSRPINKSDTSSNFTPVVLAERMLLDMA